MSISQISSAGAASSYYQTDNYYTKDGDDGQGIWAGQAAGFLEMNGKEVSPEEFEKILSGEIPNGQKLFRLVNGEKEHIPGYDITFSAPKSVSLMALMIALDKSEWHAVHDKAVAAALEWVETNVLQTRKYNKATKKQDVVGDQKMLVATFKHDISRNEDPQLHTHCVIANACLGSDGKFRSVHSQALFDNKMLIGEIFRSELKANIIEAGLGRIERTHPDGRFELRDMHKELIREFSTRSDDIAEYLGEGAHTAEDKANAALRTRRVKKESPRGELQKNWTDRISKHGYNKAEVENAISSRSHQIISIFDDTVPNKVTALENSLEHLSENSSTFHRRDVLRFTLAEGNGRFRVGEADAQIDLAINEGWIKESEDKSTLYTQATLEREMTTLHLEKAGRSSVDPILPNKAVSKTYEGNKLTSGQFEAARLILTSPNRTVGVQGYAGTGKTFMLASVAAQAQEAGYKVFGMAPTSNATKTLGKDAKIKSQTLQRYLMTPSGNHKTILFVDEASMVSTHQMMDLLTIAEGRGVAKVVLVGDTKQLESVAAGAPFKMLQAEGMRHAVMKDIKRQKKERHLEAVLSASNGDIERAFKKLGNDIREVPLEALAQQTAQAWLNSSNRENSAIVVTTNALAESVNAHVKHALIEEGSIKNRSTDLTSLKSLRLTEVQKRYANNYNEADVVRFNRSYIGLKVRAGETLALKTVRDDGVVELIKNGQIVEFKPSRDATGEGAVEAFRTEPMQINEGDKIRWTRPDYANDIQNKDQGIVSKIDQNHVTLKMSNGSEVAYEKDHGQLSFLNHAWAQTGHAYQGQTVDHIIAAMPSISGLTNQKSFYIDISRARDEVTFLTDNIDRLNTTLKERTGEERTALDLVRETESAQKFEQRDKGPIEQQNEHERERGKPNPGRSR